MSAAPESEAAAAAAASSSSSASAAASLSSPQATAAARGQKREDTDPGEAEEKSERPRAPRHFHAGPQRSKAELYRDALTSVFDFLELEELGRTAIRCSRDWQAAVAALKSRQMDRYVSKAEFLLLQRSPLRRHFSGLDLYPLGNSDPLSHSDFALLSAQVPHLTSLTGAVDAAAEPRLVPRQFPPHLTNLELKLDLASLGAAAATQAERWAHMERALRDVAGCRSLKTLLLVICFGIDDAPHVSLPASLLEQLTPLGDTLEEFNLQLDCDDRLQPLEAEHIAALRSLSKLTRLQMKQGQWSPAELALLAADPPPLHLQSFELRSTTAEHIPSLARLTGLTKLDLGRVRVSNLGFLAQLAQLADLTLKCTAQVNLEELGAALGACKRLRSLDFFHPRATEEQIMALLQAVPKLDKLVLSSCPELLSLSFLSTLPALAANLTFLRLFKCSALPLIELRHVFHLRSLTSLSINQSFSSPLDPLTVHSLTPGSLQCAHFLPNLRNFAHHA